MYSLRIRFIFVLLLIILTIALLSLSESEILGKINNAHQKIETIQKTHINLLQMRRAEKDFFARKDIKYHDKLLSFATLSKENFTQFGLEKNFITYIEKFENISKHMQILGLTNNLGLNKDFFLHAKKLEEDLRQSRSTDIHIEFLKIRQYEKDFLLYKDTEHLQLHKNMMQKIKNSRSLKPNTAILLENYNAAFEKLKTLISLVGLNENDALHGEMRTAAHTLEDELNTYIQKALPLLKKDLKTLELTQYTIDFSLLLIIFILFFIILRPVYKAVLSFNEFFTNFNDAKERLDIDSMKFTELKNTAIIVNTMLQTREDIETNLIASKNEALRLQAVKDQFLTNMSHELRTPLNAIIGFSGILKNKFPNEKKLIIPIYESSQHLLELINDILDISKIQSGKFTINNEIFNIYEKLESCLSKFEYLSSDKNISFTLDSEIDDDLYLDGDWLRVSQIITNFLSNAFKFTPENGSVTLHISHERDKLRIDVKDTGIGISDEAMQRILKPFEQADSSTTKSFGGTGLGLSISNSIVTMMGGNIAIKSKQNQGSVFSFVLPMKMVNPPQKTSVDISKMDEEELRISAHVLVVEDNKTNQMLLTMLLEDAGITYEIANDGLQAVDMYEDKKYDLVLMDENMPNMNGVDAMIKIRREYPNPSPIIAVTANVMKGDEKRLLDLGMDDFIAKPIDDDELFRTIKKHLNLH